nr:CFE protein [Ipomoea batatas]
MIDVIRYLKILLISAGAVSVSMAMKAGVPVLVHDVSAVWTGFTACLRPLYLYVAINVIIITIVLASRFQREVVEDEISMQLHPREFRRLLVTARTPPAPDLNRLLAVAGLELKPDFEDGVHAAVILRDEPAAEVNGSILAVSEDDDGGAGDYSNLAVAPPLGDEIGIFRWDAVEKSLSLADQKPPSKGLRLPAARPKQHETLENTWRMITERNHVLTPARQLRRSDSFENASADDENENHAPLHRPQNRDALKSRTFKDRTNYDSPKAAPVKARKEPSLSQDELNRRVEAFINKFNEEMRLQREQSIQQHMEMINRGAY